MKFSKIQTYKNEISKRLARPKRIYILPTKQGFYFLGINFIVFNLGNIYGNNMVLLLSFIMVAFAVVNMLLTHLNIKNVEIEGMTVHSEFADSPVEMSFKIKNKNNRAFKNLLLETWLPEKEPLGIITDIPKAQTALQVLHKGGLKRGYYQLNRLQLSTRSPSLLFVAWKVVSVECSFFIYPKRREESFFWDQEQSADKTRNEFEELNFAEHIKYHESLAANRVDWKLYAKKDELYWKKYHDESGDMLTFSFQKLSGSSEEKIEKLSYLVQKAFLENKNWKMILGDLSLGPQGGGEHREKCLETLSNF
ncbi:MAG: DUF58 domain-containing protein [Halobacteriovoraceae bacterium]|nr:DUF58 domain-containing protein [Halobacteriovoraceae bacterium]